MVKNQYFRSEGLVVKIGDDQVVLLERRYPYCLHDHLVTLYREKPGQLDLKKAMATFKSEVLPRLDTRSQEDYDNFREGRPFEDQFDFPHGQMDVGTSKSAVSKLLKEFRTAYREFTEETALSFQFRECEVHRFPRELVEFRGLDGCEYSQIYFIVAVDRVERIPHFDRGLDGLLYDVRIMDVQEAHSVLLRQQRTKRDWKHSLLRASSARNWRERSPPDTACIRNLRILLQRMKGHMT